jgi:hypothetical protein
MQNTSAADVFASTSLNLAQRDTQVGKEGDGGNDGQRVVCWGADFAGVSRVLVHSFDALFRL